MGQKTLRNIIEYPNLRDRSHVFRNRANAREVMAEMLDTYGVTKEQLQEGIDQQPK